MVAWACRWQRGGRCWTFVVPLVKYVSGEPFFSHINKSLHCHSLWHLFFPSPSISIKHRRIYAFPLVANVWAQTDMSHLMRSNGVWQTWQNPTTRAASLCLCSSSRKIWMTQNSKLIVAPTMHISKVHQHFPDTCFCAAYVQSVFDYSDRFLSQLKLLNAVC